MELPSIPKLAREESDLASHDSVTHHPGPEKVTLARSRGRRHPRLIDQHQFKNSLLAGVGYLELANAGDFAANVWNETPPPQFAVILMAIGGSVALCMVFVALQDFRLSWRNVKLLRAERGMLHALRDGTDDPDLLRLLHSRLGVGVREIGTEVVDRMLMDSLMGTGSLLVGVGTLMAIWGENPTVFEASNLLSGYVGNAMAALFGLVNAVWSSYLVVRFHHHDTVCKRNESLTATQKKRLHTRFRRFQWHSVANAVNGLVAGAASMVTATMWWGYTVLIPCIISLILCNYFWRHKLGYDRPMVSTSSPSSASSSPTPLLPIMDDLACVSSIHTALASDNPLPRTVINLDSLDSVVQFIVHHQMFDAYCEFILRDTKIYKTIFASQAELVLSPEDILRIRHPDNVRLMLDRSNRFLRVVGRKLFAYRERYLLEVVGYAVWKESL
ncbi:hypothetical protein ASPWEDRAFT_43361 [Aspergillus wentii DTO 134E9]|uniref:Integral membrane protein n=1 Tax=Aspergillus wentii DTO 134E9 TaxID=1073089 RepID=A0A1L9RED8_ASPWE|nr:uncharacterized protein ASPWEDRAFT_43361 [Aspergillus wentii DTO 134E9]KAI9933538.1 hypothetical protein MW887_008011 [Aspergillus wentii]OJJ33286.1 hypothetical protein ASPWEDRAFT_43361 [Aspergillus wentii DTO 134E9]